MQFSNVQLKDGQSILLSCMNAEVALANVPWSLGDTNMHLDLAGVTRPIDGAEELFALVLCVILAPMTMGM